MGLDIETGIFRPRMSPAARRSWLTTGSVLLLLAATPLIWAIVPPQEEDSELHQLVLSNPALHPTTDLEAINAAQVSLQADVGSAWSDFTSGESQPGDWKAQIDRRSGLVEIAEGAGVPWVPGYGNQLELANVASFLGGRGRLDVDML